MKFGKRYSLLGLALFASMSLQSVKVQASENEINQFRQAIAQLRSFEQQYQAAPSGSYQEQQANQSRSQEESYAESIINSQQAFQQIYASEDDSLLREFEQGYQAAPSGSLVERAYNTARRDAEVALQNEAIYEMQLSNDYTQTLQLSQSAEQQYQAAASGSLLETAYNAIRTQGWAITSQKLVDYSNQLQDYQQVEPLFLQFEQQYQAAPSGSKPESFYNSGRQVLEQREIALFNNQANYLGYNELNSIQAQYDQRYQAAPSGSYPESLYRAIRDAARARLGSVQPAPQPYPQPYPQPAPQPYPQPYPQPAPQPMPLPFPQPQPRPQPAPQPFPQPAPQRITCEIHSGASANGQQLFRVMTTTGAIIGTFSTTQDASAFAMQDPRCRS